MKEIFERSSVRNFTDQPVEKEKITQLMKAAMQAPSAGNQQPWEFAVVDDRAILDALSEASPYAGPLKRASLGIVVLERRSGIRFAEDTPSDLSAATENILLEAVHLGLGACWLGTAPIASRMAHVSKVLGLPEDVQPYSMIAMGYPREAKQPTPRFDETRIHYNGY
ncbi:MAG: nitroreductase family protein [Coriobacteriales bacterium]|jgi:nitroreductase|nr:nitroreductase family protein [Coriobacteriales bacterium]